VFPLPTLKAGSKRVKRKLLAGFGGLCLLLAVVMACHGEGPSFPLTVEICLERQDLVFENGRMYVLGLVDETGESLLDLVVRRQQTFLLSTDWLSLEKAIPLDGARPGVQAADLLSLRFTSDERYRIVVSLDTVAAVVAVEVVELSSEERIYADMFAVSHPPKAVELRMGAGIGEPKVTQGFAPVGLRWDYVVLDTGGVGYRPEVIAGSDRAYLKVENWHADLPGEFCLRVKDEASHWQSLLAFEGSDELVPLPLGKMPRGDVLLALDYVEGDLIWPLGETPVRIVDAFIDVVFQEVIMDSHDMIVTAEFRARSDVAGLPVGMTAQVHNWPFGGEWQLCDQIGSRETQVLELSRDSALILTFHVPLSQACVAETGIQWYEFQPDYGGLSVLGHVLDNDRYFLVRTKGSGEGMGELDDTTLREMRSQAAQRQRRIIYNNDGNDGCVGEVTPYNFLKSRTIGLEESQVDAIFYCTGVFNLYYHGSEESEPFPDVHPDTGAPYPWASELRAMGFDPLELMIEFGHAHGMEVFWSMRMNDTHDTAHTWLWSQWKEEHRDLLMSPWPRSHPFGWTGHAGWTWSALNYEHQAVRDKVLAILTDVCTRYDIDGIELDFFRHPILFKPQMFGEPVTEEHCELMTSLMRKIRQMAEEVGKKRGRPLLIAVRVPDSLGYAKAIGLDIVTWLEEDLIDLLLAGGLFQLEPWENTAALGKEYGIPVYASLSTNRIPKKNVPAWRGVALQAWEAGMDGIATFNIFDPYDPRLRELGDPALLRTLPLEFDYELDTYDLNNSWRSIQTLLRGGEAYLHDDLRAQYGFLRYF